MTPLLTCKQFYEELSDYLDDKIDAALRVKLEQHLSDCPNCWVICDTTKKTIRVYKGMDPCSIPAEVHTRLMVALEKKIAKKGS
jgi:anti-sigma factor RsiW